MLSRLLDAHETIITKVRDAITRTANLRDDGTNDILVGDVLRRHEFQVWVLAEHLVETPPPFGPETPVVLPDGAPRNQSGAGRTP